MLTLLKRTPATLFALWLSVAALPAYAADVAVKIDNFVFTPQTVEIPIGATVVWTNADDIPHTVTSSAGQFKSQALDTDDKFSYTFASPGTYDYFCALHPHMKGQIVVK